MDFDVDRDCHLLPQQKVQLRLTAVRDALFQNLSAQFFCLLVRPTSTLSGANSECNCGRSEHSLELLPMLGTCDAASPLFTMCQHQLITSCLLATSKFGSRATHAFHLLCAIQHPRNQDGAKRKNTQNLATCRDGGVGTPVRRILNTSRQDSGCQKTLPTS